MDLTTILILVALGLLLGVAAGFTGVSAVNLIVPVLYVIIHLEYHSALGTSLLIDVISAGVVTILYYRHHNVDFTMGLKMGLISFAFAILGAWLACVTSATTLANSFGFFQIIIGCVFIYRGVKKAEEPETKQLEKPKLAQLLDRVPEKYKVVILIVAAVILGLIGGIFGAGGGFAITFILIFVFAFESHKAVGTACLVMLFTATGAVIVYFIFGFVAVDVGAIIGAGTVAAAFLGSLISHKLSEKHLIVGLGIVFVVFGVIMIAYTFLLPPV